MNAKRYLLICINVIVYICSVLFLTFIGSCATLVIFALVEPLNDRVGLALLIMLGSIVPAVFLTNMLADYCRKNQLHSDEQISVEEVFSEHKIQAEKPAADTDHDSEQSNKPDDADDIPDIVQHELFSDPLFLDAVDVILRSRIVSAGRLQSELKIGSKRATRILQEMEELGIVGPSVGNRPREIFYTQEEWKTERNRFEWCPAPEYEPDPPSPKVEVKTVVVKQTEPVYLSHYPMGASNCRCGRCGGSRITFETRTEKKEIGCFTIFLCALLFFTFIGKILILYLFFSNREEPVTYATCHDCGMRWRTS